MSRQITISQLNYSIETTSVIKDVSIEVVQNQIIAVLGPSGCGKSTLLRCIAGLIQPSSGDIKINDICPLQAQKQKKIGFSFQEPCLLDWLTVSQNILLPLGLGHAQKISTEQLAHLLQLVGLEAVSNYYPYQLSGGMKQRVSFARTLITKPDVLLLDEAFSALDLLTKTKLLAEFSSILASIQTPTIMVTHHIEEAVMLADRIVILSSKPASILQVIDVPLLKPRRIDTLDDAQFQHIASLCRSIILNADSVSC